MGLTLGAAAIVGAAVGTHGSPREAITISVGLLILACILPRPRAILTGCALAGFGIGLLVTSGHQAKQPVGIHSLPDEVVGTIVSDPRLGNTGSVAELVWRSDRGDHVSTLLIYSPLTELGRNDVVRARGDWLDDTSELLFASDVEVVDSTRGLEALRSELRSRARSNVLARVPGSNGSLALGLIIGDDSGLTAGERDALRMSGLSHITAVSGSNVALVIVVVAYLLRAVGKRGLWWLAMQLTGIVGYVWIVGPDPPIVRAAIMGSLLLLAGVIGRPAHLFTLLFLAAAAMTLHDPEVLSSLAFQLSFASMIGLALAGELIARASGTLRKVVTALLSPVAATLMTAPLIAGSFGTFSPGAIPANVLVAPLIAPATVLSAIVALIPAGLPIGDAPGLMLWLLTGAILAVSEGVSSLPYAVATFAPLSTPQILGLYVLLGMLVAPLIPEARLAAFQLRAWTLDQPGPALTSMATALVMIATLTVAGD